MTVGVTLQ